MDEWKPQAEAAVAAVMTPRPCGARAGLTWLGHAWRLYKSSWLEFLLAGVLVFIIHWLLGWLPALGGLLTFFVTPLLMAGFMHMSAQAQADADPGIGGLFIAFQSLSSSPTRRLLGLGLVSLLYMLLAGVVAGVAIAAFGLNGLAFAGGADPQQLTQQLFQHMQQWGPVLAVAGIVMLLLLVVYSCAMWLAVPLVWFGECSVARALRLSLAASKRNAGGLLVFGMASLVLLSIGVLTLGLALLVVLPVLSIATYTAYKQIFAADVAQEGYVLTQS